MATGDGDGTAITVHLWSCLSHWRSLCACSSVFRLSSSPDPRTQPSVMWLISLRISERMCSANQMRSHQIVIGVMFFWLHCTFAVFICILSMTGGFHFFHVDLLISLSDCSSERAKKIARWWCDRKQIKSHKWIAGTNCLQLRDEWWDGTMHEVIHVVPFFAVPLSPSPTACKAASW